MAMEDWATRKMAIDVIYTYAAILKDAIIPFKAEILEVLNHSRFDKYKPVREATLEAYQAIKKLGGDDGVEEESPKVVKASRTSVRDAIRQDKKGKAAKNNSTFEMLDKSDHDKKLSAATQKRLENKRTVEDKKDNAGPISYDDVKSQVFKGPKNQNFFKQKQAVKKKEAEIQIFTSGDRSQFDYEDDLRKHQIQEAKIKKDKAKESQLKELKMKTKEESKESINDRYGNLKYDREDFKADDSRPINSNAGIKAPDDIPIQIYVKGSPKNKSKEPESRPDVAIDNFIEDSHVARSSPPREQARKAISKEDFFKQDSVQIEGEEYETSMNLLRQHHEMMNNRGKSQNTEKEGR